MLSRSTLLLRPLEDRIDELEVVRKGRSLSDIRPTFCSQLALLEKHTVRVGVGVRVERERVRECE